MWQVTGNRWQVTCDMWRMTRDTWRIVWDEHSLTRLWLHRETMDFFWVKTMLLKKFLSFFCQYLLFWVILKNQQSDFHIFTFSKCKDDLTGLFTSQPITVVALSTAPAFRPRDPSAGAPTLCPLALHPPGPQQLPLACQAGISWEPGQACQLPGLALHL